MGESRERPKTNVESKILDKWDKAKKATVDLKEKLFKRTMEILERKRAGHVEPVFMTESSRRRLSSDPRKIYAQKSEGKRGGWRKWEKALFAPRRDAEGKIIKPGSYSKMTRQQKRAKERAEAFAWTKEHFGAEPRKMRRRLALDKLANFRRVERNLLPIPRPRSHR